MDEWKNVGETACNSKTETDKYFDNHKNRSKTGFHLISLIQYFSQSRNQHDIHLVVEFMVARRVTPYFLILKISPKESNLWTTLYRDATHVI